MPNSLGSRPSFTKLAAPPRERGASLAPPSLGTTGSLPSFDSGLFDDNTIARQKSARNRNTLLAVGALAVVFAVGIGLRGKIGNGGASTENDTASLKASAKQDGIKLVVDGKDIGVLPQEVSGLTPGEHSITYEGGDRYASQKSKLKLEAREVRELDPVVLKVKTGAATFDVKTPGATIALVSGDERRTLSDISHPIDVDTSKSWTLEASKPGYETLRLPVSFDDRADKTFVVTLSEPLRAGLEPSDLP